MKGDSKFRVDLAAVLLVIVALAVMLVMTMEMWLPHDFR